MGQKSSQRIRYLKTTDAVRLAWAEAGSGPVVVKAANWLTHLEYEWESPVWRHWIQFFSAHYRVQRSLPEDDHWRDRCQLVRGARPRGYFGITRAGADANTRPARATMT